MSAHTRASLFYGRAHTDAHCIFCRCARMRLLDLLDLLLYSSDRSTAFTCPLDTTAHHILQFVSSDLQICIFSVTLSGIVVCNLVKGCSRFRQVFSQPSAREQDAPTCICVCVTDTRLHKHYDFQHSGNSNPAQSYQTLLRQPESRSPECVAGQPLPARTPHPRAPV